MKLINKILRSVQKDEHTFQLVHVCAGVWEVKRIKNATGKSFDRVRFSYEKAESDFNKVIQNSHFW